jgi:hypothetical protein
MATTKTVLIVDASGSIGMASVTVGNVGVVGTASMSGYNLQANKRGGLNVPIVSTASASRRWES